MFTTADFTPITPRPVAGFYPNFRDFAVRAHATVAGRRRRARNQQAQKTCPIPRSIMSLSSPPGFLRNCSVSAVPSVASCSTAANSALRTFHLRSFAIPINRELVPARRDSRPLPACHNPLTELKNPREYPEKSRPARELLNEPPQRFTRKNFLRPG
jgi:hypothetical protein